MVWRWFRKPVSESSYRFESCTLRMKKIAKWSKLIDPVSGVLGILSFFGISATSIWKNINYLKNWQIILLIISSIIIFRMLWNKLKAILFFYQEIKVKDELEQISVEKNIYHIKKALPTTKSLNFMFNKIKSRAFFWTEDVELISIYLYIDYSNGHWKKPILQGIFLSKWKKEEGWFYEGDSNNEDYQEQGYITSGHIDNNKEIFFIKNNSWQNLVIKAFEGISTRLTNNCHIAFQDYNLNITYKEGKLNKKIMYICDNSFQSIRSN